MAKPTKPDAARLHEVLIYNPEDGQLVWRARPDDKRWTSRYAGRIAGSIGVRGYVQVYIDRGQFLAHQVIWAMQTGQWPDDSLDHINGSKSDNRWENLRVATHSQNMANAVRKNQSGHQGVRRTPEHRFVARIALGGQRRYLGTFDTAEEAAVAYANAADQLFGQFSRYRSGRGDDPRRKSKGEC